MVMTLQAARGFRDPTITERCSRGPVGRGFLESNPDLRPETSRQFDLTMRYGAGRFDVHGATYRDSVNNLVERYTAGVDLCGIRNRGRARLTGAEIGVRVDAGASVSFDVIGQASRGRDAVDDTALNDIAPKSLALIARHAWRAAPVVSAYCRRGPRWVLVPGRQGLVTIVVQRR